MKYIIFILFQVIFILSNAQQNNKVFVIEGIKIISPKTNNPNEIIFADFVLNNQSNQSVSIIEIRPNCHCTVPLYPKNPIKKGVKIKIRLQTTAGQLKEIKQVDAVIKTSDPTNRFLKIQIVYGEH